MQRAVQKRGQIEGRRRRRKGFDEDGSGGRRQTDVYALEDDNSNRNEVDKGRKEAV